MSDFSYHRPVMLEECMEGLALRPGGIYVDLTFGGGGHTREIISRMGAGSRVMGFDQDQDAAQNAAAIQSSSFTFIQTNFRYFKKYLKLNGIKQVDGILADLGVSSHQIDEPTRGFSTRFDGPLDMRMDSSKGKTAADLLNSSTADDLQKLLSKYGEVRNAKTLAEALVRERAGKAFESIDDLRKVLKKYAPKGKENKYMAQVFQALRIEVNDEMAALEEMLLQCGEVLSQGGRLVVMSYHSLEDRLVKNYINFGNTEGNAEKDFYGNLLRPMAPVNRKPIEATAEEIAKNNRARSAKLRIGEKL
jgi:16S rRNA (cytosine1402-N4)-methyltransferase